MSQPNLNLVDKNSKFRIEKKKRKFHELEPYSDDDSINDDENMIKGSKERIESKRSKNKNTHNNLQNLRDVRLLKKIGNLEHQGTVLSQEQIEFAKKVVEENVSKEPKESLTSKLKIEIEKNKEKEKKEKIVIADTDSQGNSNNFEISKKNINSSNKICIDSSPNLNFTILNTKYDHLEILHYLGLLNSSIFKIVENNEDFISLEIVMEKNQNEMLKFLINFYKKSEEKDYVEYIPILTTFKFEGDDIIFYEELEIHKEDLGKMIKRLLNYKYN